MESTDRDLDDRRDQADGSPVGHYGLPPTRIHQALVALIVASLFLERFERVRADGSYPILPVPDVLFLAAVGIFTAVVVFEWMRRKVTLRPFGWKDGVLGGFVGGLGLLSLFSVVANDSDVTSGVQVLKTFSHLAFLLSTALLFGRALSHELVAHALRVYFIGAVAVAGLAIVQAVDQNALDGGVADSLDLVSRVGANGFVQPCSIFSEPAYLGYVSLGGIVVGLSLVSERHRVIAAVGCAVCVVGLLLSSAVGPVAVAVPLGLYALLVRHRLFPARIAITVAGLTAVGLLVWLMTPVSGTVTHGAEGISKGVSAGVSAGISTEAGERAAAAGSDPSFELRKELIRGSFELWKRAPIAGVGLGNTRRHLADLMDTSWSAPNRTAALTTANAWNSANAYANLLGEAGPLAVAGLVAVLVALWWRSAQAPSRLDELTRFFVVLLALAFFVVNPLIMPVVWFWAGQRLALQDV